MRKLLLALASLALLSLAACGPVQSPECAQFLDCQRTIDQEHGTSTAEQSEEDYGEDGTCWSEGAQFAQNCTESCEDALEAYARAYPDIDACQPSSED